MAAYQVNQAIVIWGLVQGAMMVPPILALLPGVHAKDMSIAAILVASAIIRSAISTFLASYLKRDPFLHCVYDTLCSGLSLCVASIVPLAIGLSIQNQLARNLTLFGITSLMTGTILMVDYLLKQDNNEKSIGWKHIIVGILSVGLTALNIYFSILANGILNKSQKKKNGILKS